MKEFVRIKATKQSWGQRKPIYGIGINDAWYMVNFNKMLCNYYNTWMHMLMRCYCEEYQNRFPVYKDCKVYSEWLLFSNFLEWMENQDWKGKELDKDILIAGNREYSPNKCIFVSKHVNRLLTDHRNARGKWAQGVHWHKDWGDNKYQAKTHINEKQVHLGYFGTEQEASEAYKKAKHKEVLRVADLQQDKKVRDGLYRHAELILI